MKGKIEQRKTAMIMALIVIMLTVVICIVTIPQYSRMQMAIGETEVSDIALASDTELENGDVLETMQQLNDEIDKYKFCSEFLMGISCVCILIAIIAVALLIKWAVDPKKKAKAAEDKSGALVNPDNESGAKTFVEEESGVANAEEVRKSGEITVQSVLEEWQELNDCHAELTERYDEFIKKFIDNVKQTGNGAADKSDDMISISREELIKRNESDIKLGKGIKGVETMLEDGLKRIQSYAQNAVNEDVVKVSNIATSELACCLIIIRKNMAEYIPKEGEEFDIHKMKDMTDAAGGTLGAVKEVKTPGRCVGNYVVERAEVIRYIEAEEKETTDEERLNHEGKAGQGARTVAISVTEEEEPKKNSDKPKKSKTSRREKTIKKRDKGNKRRQYKQNGIEEQ